MHTFIGTAFISQNGACIQTIQQYTSSTDFLDILLGDTSSSGGGRGWNNGVGSGKRWGGGVVFGFVLVFFVHGLISFCSCRFLG